MLSRIDNIDKHRVIPAGLSTAFIPTSLETLNYTFIGGFDRLDDGDLRVELPEWSKADDDPEITGQVTFDVSEPPREEGDLARVSLTDLARIYDFVRYTVYPRFAEALRAAETSGQEP